MHHSAPGPCCGYSASLPDRDPEELPPTLPAPPPESAEHVSWAAAVVARPPSVPRFQDALRAACELCPPSSRRDMESVPPASAPLKISPSFTVALLEMERDARRAELALRGVLAKAPQLAEAHYHLGVLRLRRGDGAGARLCFRTALAALRSHRGDEPPWAPSLHVLIKELG